MTPISGTRRDGGQAAWSCRRPTSGFRTAQLGRWRNNRGLCRFPSSNGSFQKRRSAPHATPFAAILGEKDRKFLLVEIRGLPVCDNTRYHKAAPQQHREQTRPQATLRDEHHSSEYEGYAADNSQNVHSTP